MTYNELRKTWGYPAVEDGEREIPSGGYVMGIEPVDAEEFAGASIRPRRSWWRLVKGWVLGR
jgi:hypothetical protein